MLHDVRVLVADDEPFIAFAIAAGIEDAHGEVIGPCASLEEIFDLLSGQPLPNAAILDLHLVDGEVTPAAEHLLDREVHVILHSGLTLPSRLLDRLPTLVSCPKPTAPEMLVRRLREMVDVRAKGSAPR